jgi:threonine aldolase
LAAACLVALEESPRLIENDHRNARFMAEKLARMPGVRIDPASVATNIVVFDVSASGLAPAEISGRLKERGVLLNAINDRQLRAVTHYDVSREDCARAVEAVAEVLAPVAVGEANG